VACARALLARPEARAFEAGYGAKLGKAVAKITDDLDELLAFYDYPAEHWIHLRATPSWKWWWIFDWCWWKDRSGQSGSASSRRTCGVRTGHGAGSGGSSSRQSNASSAW
jgi:hypothetical protein